MLRRRLDLKEDPLLSRREPYITCLERLQVLARDGVDDWKQVDKTDIPLKVRRDQLLLEAMIIEIATIMSQPI